MNVAMLVFSANATGWDEQPPAACHFAKREPYDAADTARRQLEGSYVCSVCTSTGNHQGRHFCPPLRLHSTLDTE